MSDPTKLPISEIKIGERHRKDMGDIAALAKSIEELDLLQPIVVNMDHELIAGVRRLEAVKQLGWVEVPVRIIDMKHIVRGEHAENEMRKDFTTSERVAIGEEVERILGNRQGQRTDLQPIEGGELSKNFPEVTKGKTTREVAAKRAGFRNPTTYSEAEHIFKTGVQELKDAVDRKEVSVNAGKQIATLPPEEQRAASVVH